MKHGVVYQDTLGTIANGKTQPNTAGVSHTAGSIGITHFDVYHRGTHRSAGPDLDKRIMIKLWYFRTRDPYEPTWAHTPADDDDAPLAFHTDAGAGKTFCPTMALSGRVLKRK